MSAEKTVYVAACCGDWPEDGQKIGDVYESEEAAREAAEEMVEESHMTTAFVRERTLHCY